MEFISVLEPTSGLYMILEFMLLIAKTSAHDLTGCIPEDASLPGIKDGI